MKIPHELTVRAINNGIFITRDTTLTRLIRNIQRCEGERVCFMADDRNLCEKSKEKCEWHDYCQNTLIAHWHR